MTHLNQRMRDWRSLPTENLQRKLAALGIYLDRPGPAVVCTLCSEKQQRVADEERNQWIVDTGVDGLALTSNWMRRGGWASSFAGANRLLLLNLAEPAAADDRRAFNHNPGRYGIRTSRSSAEDERRLAVIDAAVDCFFDQCEDTISGPPYKAPFELTGRHSTATKYCGYWKRSLYFVFRLCYIEDAVREELLQIQLSDQQRQAIAAV
ncbi:hypothetical protein LTR28_009420 [Elasticomyces elasticus]|nr:hypothetical protein LTR28_009420 [Elasticomyces elasticus]